MKQTILSLVFLSVTFLPQVHSALVYSDDFNGSAASDLNGTAPDIRPGSETWIAATTVKADGSTSGSVSGWLPYAFDSSLYEIKLGVNTSFSSGSTSFVTLAFITGNSSDWTTGQFNTVVGTYSILGFRRNRDIEFWAGPQNSNNVDGGSFSSGISLVGELRLLLNTTGSQWTIDGFYTPNGGSEITLDLNGAAAGSTYTYSTNPPSFTGLGFSTNSGATLTSFSLSVIPEPSILGLALFGIAPLLFRKKK